LKQQLEEKEEALTNLQEKIQEHRETNPLYIATVEANTMTKTTLVTSPSLDLSQENLGNFENHTRGIGSKLLRKIGYDRQGIGKAS